MSAAPYWETVIFITVAIGSLAWGSAVSSRPFSSSYFHAIFSLLPKKLTSSMAGGSRIFFLAKAVSATSSPGGMVPSTMA